MTAKGDHYFSHLVNMTQDSKVGTLLAVVVSVQCVAIAGECGQNDVCRVFYSRTLLSTRQVMLLYVIGTDFYALLRFMLLTCIRYLRSVASRNMLGNEYANATLHMVMDHRGNGS